MRRLVDEVIQRLPDEEPFKRFGWILIGTKQGILGSLESQGKKYPEQKANEHYLNMIRDAKRWWDSRADSLKTDEDIRKANVEMRDDPDGNSEIQPIMGRDGRLIFEDFTYRIQIFIDYRNRIRTDSYFRGVIVHEFAEYTTKYYTAKNHQDEIKVPDDFQLVLKKYLKSGTTGEEYKEHEKIVNKEAIRLGFRKEIEAMDGPQD